jgi:hypothetical protein
VIRKIMTGRPHFIWTQVLSEVKENVPHGCFGVYKENVPLGGVLFLMHPMFAMVGRTGPTSRFYFHHRSLPFFSVLPSKEANLSSHSKGINHTSLLKNKPQDVFNFELHKKIKLIKLQALGGREGREPLALPDSAAAKTYT